MRGSRLGNKVRIDAAWYVAEGKLTNREIAQRLDLSRKTIERWTKDERFVAIVKRMVEEFEEKATKKGIALRRNRIAVLQKAHDGLETVMAERSLSEEMKNIPGGQTGLITKMLKGIGKGGDFQVVEVYEVDTGTLKEIRAIHERITEELGEKVTKHEHSGPGGKPIESAFDKLVQLLAG